MDAQLVEKIVHEVKSQGVFDEFRKDSMADVDTKPAYQNLRQRVENTVKKFLVEQKWTPDTNKNQLREKLRRHITESGFLDVGVERIVDQVVNPKIGSVFQPRIEEIAYNYLGLPPPTKYEPPPPLPLMHPLPPLPLNAPPLTVETCSLLPTDLDQVSPDSDKATVKSEVGDDKTAIDMETDDKIIDDEDESPPFEPLVKHELENVKIEFKVEKMEEKVKVKKEIDTTLDDKKIMVEESIDGYIKADLMTDNDSQELSNFAPEGGTIDKEASQSMDARISQDSQLSSVSSDSRLSVDAKDFLQSSSQEAVAANISEEAQMPKFSENSSELNAINGDENNEKDTKMSELHFDIKKDEIKFEGTERKCSLKTQEISTIKTEEVVYSDQPENPSEDKKKESFKFSNISIIEAKEEYFERTPNAQESSFGSSIDDSSSVPSNTTPKSCLKNKDKETLMEEKSPILKTPKQELPSTPNTTPIPTPPMPTPTTTPSPITSQKIDKDNSSRHSSSSSSKHKKHSKDRRRSHDREKDKEHHRSNKDIKDSSSKYYSNTSGSKSSKHSSMSSSKSSSTFQNKSSNEKDLEKFSSSSTHSSSKHSKHYHSSSSSNEHNDSKRSKGRDSERRHHSSSSTHKEHSSSSKRSDKKDDHNEAKHKIQRRKSTDSNDDNDDKSLGGGGKSSSHYQPKNSSSASKSSKSKSGNEDNKSPSTKTSDSQKDNTQLQTDNEKFPSKPHFNNHNNNNVIILNDILENPQTQFIQLDKTGHLVETPLQSSLVLNSIEINEPSTEFNNNIEIPPTKEEKIKLHPSMDLLYFEGILPDFTERIKLLDNTMDLCRRAVNSLRFEGIELSNEDKSHLDNNKSNLLMEALKRKSELNYGDYEKTPRKRVASNESECCPSKTSPTPSDSSANSKENEEIDKNTDMAKKSVTDRHKAVQRLTQQQRYSSEDLYKPRPILGQRSRRRGMDSLV